MAGVFVPGQQAWAAPDAAEETSDPAPDRGPDGLQAPDAASALTIARLEGEKVEVIGERTATSSTWALPNGTLTLGQAIEPVWVRQPTGDGTAAADWAPLDLTLTLTPDGDIAPVSYPVELTLDAGGGVPESGSLVAMGNGDGEQVSISWTEDLPEVRLEGPRAIYQDVAPGIDMVVEATRTGYEQFFVLTEAPADPAALNLSLQLRTEGLTATLDETGGVEYTGGDGEAIGSSGTPLVWDAEVDAERQHPITEPFVAASVPEGALTSGLAPVPDETGPLQDPDTPTTTDPQPAGADLGTPGEGPPLPSQTAAEPGAPDTAGQGDSEAAADAGASTGLALAESATIVDSGVYLALTPDVEFLADPATTYPVVIDPAADFGTGFDTWVQTGTGSDQSGSTELRVGTYDGGVHVARSFLNFDLSGVRYKTVLQASLNLYEFHAYSCSASEWQVYNSAPATTAARINNQPATYHRQAISAETRGYGPGCDDGWVAADLTNLVQAWSTGGYTEVGMMLRASGEADYYGWKKFNSANAGWGVPTLYINWNTPPAPATGVAILPMNQDGGAYATQTLTPTLSATVNDADGAAHLAFEIFKTTGERVWSSPWTYNVPNGSVGSIQVHAGALTEGPAYIVRAVTWDGIQYNTMYQDTGQFTVDLTNPATPSVSSTAFPSNGRWSGSAGQAGNFTLTLPAADATVTGYRWGLDVAPTTKVTAAPVNGTTFTLPVTPATNGVHTLQVQSVDRSGRESQIVRYTFNVGEAGVVSPVEGAQVVRKVRLQTTGKPNLTHAQFVWRRGPDATAINPVPLSALTMSDGSPVSTTWTSTAAIGDYLTWDASLTLGDAPGPVQVAAYMAVDANGTGPGPAPGAYLTGWVTVTVSPDAAYAASDSVGPGSVNLLTGEYSLSATDVDEFGLALGRSTSSRNTQSGYELQPEALTEAMQTMSNVAGYAAGNASVTMSTAQWHTGNNSMRLSSTNSSVDSFAAPLTLLNLRPGGRYRVSGWIYVPAATGLNTGGWSQRLNAYYQKPDGGYHHEASPMAPSITDAWQYLSLDIDIPLDAIGAGQVRLYNGTVGKDVFYDDISVREVWAPLGPQWSLGTADGVTGAAYTHITQPYSDVAALHLAGGGEIWFTYGNGRWFPEPGAESLTLTQPTTGQWKVTDLDGTVSTFAIGVSSTLAPDQRLGSGMNLTAANGRFRAVMTPAGALTLYAVDPATGATGAQRGNFNYAVPGATLHMQPDGNLVALNPAGAVIWQTGTGNSPGARLVMREDGNLAVTRPNGTIAWAAGSGEAGAIQAGDDTVARLVSSSPAVATGQSRLVYEPVNGRMRLTRLIAPIQPGVDNWPANTAACTTATPAAGCQVQELIYAPSTPATTTATSFGDFAARLVEVRLWSSTPQEPTPTAVAAVRYAYDNTGKLREVWDPRITPVLKTAYTYDTDGRVLTSTGAGELPWRFSYGTGGARSAIGNGDLIDRSSGRLLSVTRASLQPGSLTATGPDTTSTVVYNVPLNRAAGGPYDLNSAALATWAQTRGPTDATAIFGPENVPTVTTATSSSPGSDGYRPATVHYLDASGREVNTATPTGTDAPAAGFIDTAEYDRFGNVVRSLDATNRLLALGQLPSAPADLAALNLTTTNTATRALALSSISDYSPDGLDVLRTRGPLLRVAIGNNPADVRLAHAFTANVYDEGKPDGVAYHLLTTGTEGVVLPAADWRAGAQADLTSAGQLIDLEVTVNGYDPIDGASPIGPTSGWKIGSPTVVTGDAGAGGVNLVSRVRYDVQGRAVESRKVGSTGSDAGTVRSVFYTAGANPDRSECGNNAHYAGLPCVNYNAAPTTGSDTARMATGLPVRTVSAYNRYGSIATVTETATGPLAGTTVTQSRTTTTTYDEADRVTSVAITAAGAGVTPSALPKTTTTYDPASGDVTAVSTVDAGGIVLARTAKVFDALGRMTSYTDAAGGVTTTTFDRYGKPVTVADSTGASTTFTYDRTAEPRGYVTSVADSVGGTISATYGPDGQVLTQSLPGGVQLRIAYDAGRTPISRTYVRTSDQAVISSSAVVENGSGQFVTHTTPASTKTYAYDRLGRLTNVTDLTAGIASCTTRAYTYGNRAERLSRSVNRSANSTCPTATGTGSTSTSYSYDSGDRLVSDTATGPAGWVYDPLGRIVDAPVASNPGARVQNAYWANDLIASQTIANVARQTWTLDPLQRFSEFTSETWMNNAWQQAVTKVNHYDSDSDSPAWISEDKSLPTEITRYVDGLDGSLAMQTGKAGARVLQLIDLQGSVMTTLPIADGATSATWTGIRHQTADEFGTPTDLTTGRARTSTGASPDKNNRYGWLGGAQRSTQALAGVTLMGVRLYDPNTGRFWSTDPVPGGNATTYDYCSGDPVNCTDLDGRWSLGGFLKKAVKVAAIVGEIASNIPGPIGAAAAGISAVAYAVQGNRSKAIEMGITAAAAMVPGGGAIVRAGARAVRAAGNVAGKAGRAAAKVVRGGGSSCKRNSFTGETQVKLANGSHIPISEISLGDMVLTVAPQTGVVTAQAVIDVIVGYGERHLYRISVGPDENLVTDAWTATSSHEVWVVDRGWTEVEDLRRGDSLVGSDGSLVTVSNVQDQGVLEHQRVFNLTVANVHTFFVGDGHGSLVHNCAEFVGDAAGRSNDELADLAYRHSGEGFANGARRPSLSEITKTLGKGSRTRQHFPNGGSSVRIEHGNVRVYVNEVNANRSTAYYIDRRPKRRR